MFNNTEGNSKLSLKYADAPTRGNSITMMKAMSVV